MQSYNNRETGKYQLICLILDFNIKLLKFNSY